MSHSTTVAKMLFGLPSQDCEVPRELVLQVEVQAAIPTDFFPRRYRIHCHCTS